MKGASAEPLAATRTTPNKSKNTTMGSSHHFLLSFRNSQNSFRIDSLFMGPTRLAIRLTQQPGNVFVGFGATMNPVGLEVKGFSSVVCRTHRRYGPAPRAGREHLGLRRHDAAFASGLVL